MKAGQLYAVTQFRWLLPVYDRSLEAVDSRGDWRKVGIVLYLGRSSVSPSLHEVMIDGRPAAIRTRMLDFLTPIEEEQND